MYANDLDVVARAKLEAELAAARQARDSLEKERDQLLVAKKTSNDKNVSLTSEINLLQEQLGGLKLEVDTLRGSLAHVESENELPRDLNHNLSGYIHDMNHNLSGFVHELRKDVDKGTEDIADALSKGYGMCYDRLLAAGFDMSHHTFDHCVVDLDTPGSQPEPASRSPSSLISENNPAKKTSKVGDAP